jgi:hypothetical protein
LFPELYAHPVVLQFDQTQGSSDGGALLLAAANRRYGQGEGLIERLAACLPDRRQAGKVDHTFVELLRQRTYGLACGYPSHRSRAE